MNSIIEEIKVLSASDNIIKNGSFEIMAAPLELISNVDFSTWTYDSGAITSFADYSGTVAGTVKASDVAHGLSTSDLVEIRDCTTANGSGYDGAYSITKIDDDNYYFTHAWDGTETADWVKIDTNPTSWVSSTKTLTDYIVPVVGGGIKFYSETITLWFLQQTLSSNDIADGATGIFIIDIESLTSGELVIKNGSETIQTITEAGVHTFYFDKESSDVIQVFGSSSTTEAVINSFSIMNTKLFEDWDSFITGSATIEESLGYVENKSVKFEMTEVGTTSYIVQRISGADLTEILGKEVVFGFAYKSNGAQVGVLYNIDDGGWQGTSPQISNEDWNYTYITIVVPEGSTSLNIRIGLYLPNLLVHYVMFDDAKLYYINEEELEKELITEKDNLRVRIEDDLFTFISNDISMELRNVANSGYMNPMNFITEDKLYAIVIKYNSGTSTIPVYQYQYLFTNWDNCSREQTNDSDYISLSFFELSGLLSDMNWYLGRYIYDPEVSDFGVYNFRTENPLILDKDSPLAPSPAPDEDLLNDRLLPALQNVVVQNMLPVYPNNINLEIEDNLLSDIGFISNIDMIDGEGDGKKRLLDYFIDTETDRLFILTIDNIYDDGESIDGKSVEVYEIANGSTPVFIHQFSLVGDLDNFLDIGFIHRWDTYPDIAGGHLVVIQVGRQNTADIKVQKVSYKYNSIGDTVFNTHYIYNDFGIIELFNYGKAYIDIDGLMQKGGTIINASWIADNLTALLFNGDYVYTLSNEESYSDDYGSGTRYMVWCGNMSFNLTKFPKYLQLIDSAQFIDSTLANIMKEICVTQDALWYFKYTSSNGITLYIRRRAIISGEEVVEIDNTTVNSDVKTIGTKLSIITFDDITSSIYINDPYRIKVFREWYNAKYGGGKQLKTLTMWDIQNLVLGDVKALSSDSDKYLMIKYLEWDRENSETKVELFEIGEDE